MLKRQTSGSVVCPSCGSLVGVRDERCYNCGRWNPGFWGYAPALRRLGGDFGFVPFVIGGCAILYAVTFLASGASLQPGGLFSILPVREIVLLQFGGAGNIPVFYLGRWWTVLSAGWLHGSLLHILFNMLWVRQLGPATSEVYGPGRMIIIYTVAGICGFALSSLAGLVALPIPLLQGAQLTIGASAPIFGLLGGLVSYSRRSGSSLVGREAMGYALTLFIFGLMMPGVDNFAHAGGFLGGYIAGGVLDARRPERFEHILAAFICLLATIAAIVASILTPLPPFG